jgi:hypothetical protein
MILISVSFSGLTFWMNNEKQFLDIISSGIRLQYTKNIVLEVLLDIYQTVPNLFIPVGTWLVLVVASPI